MTRDPYQGSIYDPASLHRYNYARSNPVNFVDPSGRDAIDYSELALNSIRTGVTVTAITAVVKCQLWAIASTVGIIGQHLGLDTQENDIQTLWNSCEASLDVSNLARNAAINSAFGFGFGALGPPIGRGIGWLLDDAAEGAAAQRLVALDADAVVKFNSPGVQGALQPGDRLVVTPNVVQELQNSVGIKDINNFLSQRGIAIADGTTGATVPATFLTQQLDAIAGVQAGNAGDALNLSEAGGIGADVFITGDAGTIGRTFGNSGIVFLPESGGTSIPILVVK